MELPLEDFGRSTVGREAARYSLTVEELVRYAVEYYLWKRHSGRQAVKLPRFSRGGEPAGPAFRLSLELDDSAWEDLQDEAQRQGSSLELVVEHAVLLLLADLDSGRAVSVLEEND